MLPPRPAVDGDSPPADELAPAPDALAPAPDELAPPDAPAPLDEPAPMLLPPPILAFFSTKVSPPADVLDALAELLDAPELLVLDPSPRCKQPVAVTDPAVSDAERPVVGWPLCGVLDVGDCAASVPHRAMLLLSVIAHCQ